jgi:hypothetical protein
MADPMDDGPTEEEMRAYLENLRAAQPVEVIVQAFGLLATAANVKVGQSDARVLIDGMAALLDATAAHVPEQIARQMRETVSQLQFAQVQAEKDAAPAQSGGGRAAAAEPTGTAAEQPPQEQPQQQRPDPASRLWIPGRD